MPLRVRAKTNSNEVTQAHQNGNTTCTQSVQVTFHIRKTQGACSAGTLASGSNHIPVTLYGLMLWHKSELHLFPSWNSYNFHVT